MAIRVALLTFLLATLAGIALGADALRDGFPSPPESAKPLTWWHWMQGNITREGITADLESMREVGLGGALLFHVGQLPIDGDVKFMSDEWWQLMRHAVDEAARLQLRLGFHNCPGWSATGGPWVTPEQSMQRVIFSETLATGPAEFAAILPQGESKRSFYRDITVMAMPVQRVVLSDQQIDLTDRMDASGKLTWAVPAGNWKILRFGHTTTGQGNAPAPPGAWGLECDKMSREALAAHYNAYAAKILANAGPQAGEALKTILIDSYEAGDQNWTPRMAEEFSKRRGYDIAAWLPTLAGQVIGSEEQTTRFRYDLTRTIAELYAENTYAAMRDLVHRTPGMQFAVEPYGGPFTTAETGAAGDIVTGEFWQKPAAWYHISPIASVAHVNGKRIVAAEAFTGAPQNAQWRQDPYSLKGSGDRAFALGVNMLVLHTYAHQPWTNVAPGMTMGWWGTHFGRTQTWWGSAKPWVSYLSRCQYLLQQGLHVADVLQLEHENAVPGYSADTCGEHDLQRLVVNEGRLSFPDGMSYGVLALPDSQQVRPETLRRIRDLVDAGANVIGPRPASSPSLQNYPGCDEEVRSIAAELWGTAKAAGRISNRPAQELLIEKGIAPDVAIKRPLAAHSILWTHRRTDTHDIYFISNQSDAPVTTEISFRITGRQPELWNPGTGGTELASLWRETDGRTDVTLDLDPSGSTFVVFGPPSKSRSISRFSFDGQPVGGLPLLPEGFAIRKATYGVLSDPAKCVDVTRVIAERAIDGVFRAGNALAGDPAPMVVKALRVEYSVAGKDAALVILEGEELGIPGMRYVPPAGELREGGRTLRAWRNGSYTSALGAGEEISTQISGLPEVQMLNGPWDLTFPPKLGAPAGIRLQTLIPLNEHSAPGVRYFSGTATYRTRFTVSAEMLRAGDDLWLDLGEVANLADVRVNGKPLEILWKPPFRVALSGRVRAGDNELEVAVTNLWPNRMIGDEQEPDDCTWGELQTWNSNGSDVPVGRPLMKVPDWVRTGAPRPSAGRVTFTSYKFYTKDSPLLRAGLVGPVRLLVSRDVQLVD